MAFCDIGRLVAILAGPFYSDFYRIPVYRLKHCSFFSLPLLVSGAAAPIPSKYQIRWLKDKIRKKDKLKPVLQ